MRVGALALILVACAPEPSQAERAAYADQQRQQYAAYCRENPQNKECRRLFGRTWTQEAMRQNARQDVVAVTPPAAVSASSAYDMSGAMPAWMGAERRMLATTLRPANGVTQGTSRLVTGLILTALSKVSGLSALGESDIDAALSLERKKDALGCDSVSCMAELGAALGVEFVLYGELGQLGGSMNLNLSVLHVKTMQVRARESRVVSGSDDRLAPEIRNIVAALVHAVNR
ncbi:MAG: hypothetical protein IT381_30150 [Deltaproteobacteria bacterium]|nr:hypothetical protein [Deltaproteobacteria bacterium]